MERAGPPIASLSVEIPKKIFIRFWTCGRTNHAPLSRGSGTGELRPMVEELWKKTLEQAASNIRERRTGPRYSFVAGAEFVDVQTNSRMPGRASDLDRGGCFIDTLNPFPVGTALTLRLTNEK